MNVDLNPVSGIPHSNNLSTNMTTNPVVIAIVAITLIIYYSFFSSLGKSVADSGTESITKEISSLEIMLWALFIILILLNGVDYFSNNKISADLTNVLNSDSEIDIKVNNSESKKEPDKKPNNFKLEKEVFHIPNNKYTYDDAKAICKAHGANLANYKQMKDAFDTGADWCSYGWSDDQMIFYPTQYEKWSQLQKNETHKHDCGRPGLNGGYVDNPNARFGANCFGYKPSINEDEKMLMQNSSLFPKTKKEIRFDEKVAKYKEKLHDIIVSPFNSNSWSVLSFSNLF